MKGSILDASACPFFCNGAATTAIYTLSLHDALPILGDQREIGAVRLPVRIILLLVGEPGDELLRSEEHTSELQSRPHLVCRLLLEKKNPPGVMSRRKNGDLTPLLDSGSSRPDMPRSL